MAEIQNPDVKLYIGTQLTVTIKGSHGAFGRNDGETYALEAGINKINTDNLTPGNYTLVDYTDPIEFTRYVVKSPFGKQSQLEQIKEMIRAIRACLLARVSGDDAYLQSMASDGYTFAYASIMELEELLSANERRLARAKQADDIKKGKSPMRTIKARFRHA